MAAEAREFVGVRRLCRREKKLDWPVRFAREAELAGRRWVLVANGAGRKLAGEACEIGWNKVRPDILVSTGFCGALDPALKAGEVLVATEVESLDEAPLMKTRQPQSGAAAATGRVISTNCVVQTVEQKAALHARGASAVEMEAAAVGFRAKKWGVPFYCVRAVTDLAHETLELDFNAVRASDGHLSTALILWAALRRPNPLASELYRLNRRSRLAARALGEYLADCQF